MATILAYPLGSDTTKGKTYHSDMLNRLVGMDVLHNHAGGRKNFWKNNAANLIKFAAAKAQITRWHLLNTDTALFSSSEWKTREVWAAFARSEAAVYGASRLGTDHERKTVIRRKYRQVWNPLTLSWFNTEAVSPDSSETPEADTVRLCYRAGFKQYALSNHLGNVLATVSDRVILEDTTADDTADAHLADLLSAQDYYPFGMQMPGRTGSLYLDTTTQNVTFQLEAAACSTCVKMEMRYRYGFNGKEDDPEWQGKGNSYDYGFRIYNPRIGKFLSVDPLAPDYPHNSPYAFSENRVIDGVELEGLEWIFASQLHFAQNHKLSPFLDKFDASKAIERSNGARGTWYYVGKHVTVKSVSNPDESYQIYTSTAITLNMGASPRLSQLSNPQD